MIKCDIDKSLLSKHGLLPGTNIDSQLPEFKSFSSYLTQGFRISSRNNPMGLMVALDDSGSASGDLFWDDGESLGRYGEIFTTEQWSIQLCLACHYQFLFLVRFVFKCKY